MFKRNIFKILAVVFFLLAGATFYNSNRNKQTQLVESIKPIPTSSKGLINQTPTQIKPTQLIQPTQYIIPISITKGSENPTPTNIPPTSAPQGLKVLLSINGSSVGTIDLSAGANQCDVLSQALSQGKIQSLNMRYNNDMGTNAVYQINGVGKENAVWWGFKVNGQSPSQGCSYIKVNDGDSVLWEYVGN